MNLQELLQLMIKENGSDLHLRAGSPPAIRINGIIRMIGDTKLHPSDVEQLAMAVMTPRQQEEFKTLNEIDFAFGISNLGRFRTNIYRQRGTLSINLRAIPMRISTIEELGLPEVLYELALKPRGMILVTGITGSGKSTTLAAMIDHINKNSSKNIITIENPIEFLHRTQKSIISQREIGTDTQDFRTALKYILRQDPDVIMIGEMRDLETIETALMAADTGHLVLSTLHTLDAPETINRIISFYPPHQHRQVRSLLAATLQAVLSQRLLPRADGRGRVAAMEIMIATETIREYIMDETKTKMIRDVIQEGAVQYKMQTFDQSIMKLYNDGIISYETGLEYASNPSEFTLRVGGIEASSDKTWDTFKR